MSTTDFGLDSPGSHPATGPLEKPGQRWLWALAEVDMGPEEVGSDM